MRKLKRTTAGSSSLALLFLLASAAPAAAQRGKCDFESTSESTLLERSSYGGNVIVRVDGPFRIRCADGAEIRALKAVINQNANEVQLDGNVRFHDEARTLTSKHATYNSMSGRLYANGDVVFADRKKGSTVRSPELEYYRAMRGGEDARAVARGRPHMVMQKSQSDSVPLIVDADQVIMVGESRIVASGRVEIRRDSIRASADDARYDEVAETLELTGRAKVMQAGSELTGERIVARLQGGELSRVYAYGGGEMKQEGMSLKATQLDLAFENQKAKRVVARSMGRAGGAIAISDDARVSADSLDAHFLAGDPEEMFAVGRARVEAENEQNAGTPDWIRGDLVHARFAAAAKGEKVQLETLTATGAAESLHHLHRERPKERRPVNYLAGRRIVIRLIDGEMSSADVSGLTAGAYLEPEQRKN